MSSLSLEKVDENEIHRKASIVESLIDTEDELSDLSVHDDVLREDTPVQGTPVQSDDDDRKVNDTQSPTTNNVDNQLPDSNIENSLVHHLSLNMLQTIETTSNHCEYL